MPVRKKHPLKTVALAVRLKAVTEKPDKSKATKSIQGRAQSWWRPSRA